MSENNQFLFDESIKIGKEREKIVFELLKPHVDHIEDNDDYKWDILIKKGHKKITIEVKFDSMFLKTGNFAVEFECRGKPSGIKTTESNYWVFVDSDNKIHCIETIRLKELCKNAPIKPAYCADGVNYNYLIKDVFFSPHKIKLLNILD